MQSDAENAVPLLLGFALAAMIVHWSLLAVEFGCSVSEARAIAFDAKAWKANKDPMERYLMNLDHDLYKRFIGLTKPQLIELLGQPDGEGSQADTLAYRIRMGYRCDGDSNFELTMKNGRVTGYVMPPSNCYGEIGFLDYLLPFRVGDDGNYYWVQWHDVEVLKRMLRL